MNKKMLQGLLLLALKKVGAKIGETVAKKIQEALMGHETTLGDIKILIEGLQHSINGLPEEVVNHMVKFKYVQTISQVEHDIKNNRIVSLLRFLGEENSGASDTLYFWGLTNVLCINMTGVSATRLESEREQPEKINFNHRGYIQKVNRDLLRSIRPITEYIDGVSNLVVMLSASIVTVQHVAIKALKTIAEVKGSDPLYDRCQAILNSSYTKKYLPFNGGKVSPGGLSGILSPALSQCPRSVVGTDLAEIYEQASETKTSKLSFMSHRYRSSKNRYLQWSGSKNPWTSSDKTKNWFFEFDGNERDTISIYHSKSQRGSHMLFIGFPEHSQELRDYGVWTGRTKAPSWSWFIVKRDSRVVHLFRNGSGKHLAQVLSTNYNFRNFIEPGKGLNYRAYWILGS